jgi:DNA-binding protein HU-beta
MPQIAGNGPDLALERPISLLSSRPSSRSRGLPWEQGGVMTTKSEFVDKVAASSGLSKKDASAAVDAVISTIESELKSGGEVSFTGFGKFHVAERGAREGRNPRTGETMTIAASRVPRFTAGSGLKKAVK